jgi:hypothetical protein
MPRTTSIRLVTRAFTAPRLWSLRGVDANELPAVATGDFRPEGWRSIRSQRLRPLLSVPNRASRFRS